MPINEGDFRTTKGIIGDAESRTSRGWRGHTTLGITQISRDGVFNVAWSSDTSSINKVGIFSFEHLSSLDINTYIETSWETLIAPLNYINFESIADITRVNFIPLEQLNTVDVSKNISLEVLSSLLQDDALNVSWGGIIPPKIIPYDGARLFQSSFDILKITLATFDTIKIERPKI